MNRVISQSDVKARRFCKRQGLLHQRTERHESAGPARGPIGEDCDHDGEARLRTKDKAGADPEEWPGPGDLRLQQIPGGA